MRRDSNAGMMSNTDNQGALGLDFSWLLSPLNQEIFIRQYWAKSHLRINRNDICYYSQLLPEKELEFVLYIASKTPGAVELLSENESPQGCRSQEQALEGVRHGKSIRIDGIQRFSHPIIRLCRSLEQIISCPVNVNMYLTPGSGRKALPRHYDNHDVFVLQIHGNKTWRLYNPPFLAPLEFLPLQRHESVKAMTKFRLCHDMSGRDACTLTDEFIMQSGDCLYLPRGFWHEAESAPGEVSCHLTVGIQPTTYLDVLNVALSQAAQSDLRLREPLPFGYAVDPTAVQTVTAQIAKIVEGIPQRLNAESALSEVSSHFSRIQKTSFSNNLLHHPEKDLINSLTDQSPVFLISGMRCEVDAAVSPPQLRFGPNVFEIPSRYKEACIFISKVPYFKVSDLPGQLTLPEKILLVRQLISEGVFTLSPNRSSFNESFNANTLPGPEWIPVKLNLNSNNIQWIHIGKRQLTEPFLHQTIEQIKKRQPDTRIRTTSFQALEAVSETIPPSGFIFHISRCGSTLLSNAIKAISGTIVISEPQPISEALLLLSNSSMQGNSSLVQREHNLIRSLVGVYGRPRLDDDKALVIKFSSWNILHIATIRKLWPQVPCVIVVRQPIEVAVSCLEQLSGWMRWKKQPDTIKLLFGWDKDNLSNLSDSEFCSKVITEFLKCASSVMTTNCQLIDYKDLTRDRIVEIIRSFAIEIMPEDTRRIEESLTVYSKDPNREYLFTNDSDIKQNKATDTLRSDIRQWAQPVFDAITQSHVEQV